MVKIVFSVSCREWRKTVWSWVSSPLTLKKILLWTFDWLKYKMFCIYPLYQDELLLADLTLVQSQHSPPRTFYHFIDSSTLYRLRHSVFQTMVSMSFLKWKWGVNMKFQGAVINILSPTSIPINKTGYLSQHAHIQRWQFHGRREDWCKIVKYKYMYLSHAVSKLVYISVLDFLNEWQRISVILFRFPTESHDKVTA